MREKKYLVARKNPSLLPPPPGYQMVRHLVNVLFHAITKVVYMLQVVVIFLSKAFDYIHACQFHFQAYKVAALLWSVSI